MQDLAAFEAQQAVLEAFLASDQVGEDALDYIASHGFITALVVCPETVSAQEWQSVLFEDVPSYTSAQQQTQVTEALSALYQRIEYQLYNGLTLKTPCELVVDGDLDELPLQQWCIGFMEGVFMREDAWVPAQDEDSPVAQLLMPIMTVSGLFEDDLFVRLQADSEALVAMCMDIPEVITDLYLQLREAE